MPDLYMEDVEDFDFSDGQLHYKKLLTALCAGDIRANKFGIRAYQNGVPFSLAGKSCKGYFTGPDGTVTTITGNDNTGISGNKAWVRLPEACYSNQGPFRLAIKITGGGTMTARIIEDVIE